MPPLPAAPPIADAEQLPAWRRPTAVRIFGHAMFGFGVWVAETFLLAAIVTHEGRSDNFEGVVANLAILATIAATEGGWIGFVFANRPRSDRGLILLASWGLSFALALAVLLAVQHSSAHVPGSALDGVASEFCVSKNEVLAAFDAVRSASTAKELVATASTALSRLRQAALTYRDLAPRAEAAGDPQLATDFRSLAAGYQQLARALQRLDDRGTDAAAATLIPVVYRVMHTPPISDICG
jgi:hypothetical protein